MTRTRVDRWLEGAGFAIALIRVLRGEQPDRVIAQTREMVTKADTLRASIDAHMGEAEPAARPAGSGNNG
jgi:hypothetical protein